MTAVVDTDDIHALVTAASGAGKTAFFLYPNIEYALATGMSFLCTDTKGDLFRNYAGIARECYGYQTAILDLRNPTRSDGNNLLHLINKYMDIYKAEPDNLAAKAKAEKYAKILAKTLINTSGGDSAQYGQNAFFYDSAEGLLTAMFLLVAEYLPPRMRKVIPSRSGTSYRCSTGAGTSRTLKGQGKKPVPAPAGQAPAQPQGQVVRRFRPQHGGAGYGLGSLHRPLPTQRFPGQRDGADPLL